MNGFIVIDRNIEEWRWWGNTSAMGIWLLILVKANWKDGYFQGELIPRGSFATSISNLALETGMSESTIRRWLKRFEDDGQIEQKVTNRYRVIKVLNYAKYQDVPDDMVNSQMTGQVTGLMTGQMTGLMTPNRTNKQSNNIPPLYSPRGKRAKKHQRVVIDTPEWYRKQKSGVAKEKREIDEDLIREIEELKETMTGKGDDE